MIDRLTLASSHGLPFVGLAFHAIAGTAGLISGWVAITTRKGGSWHRRSGLIFVTAMIAMGLSAVGVSLYEGMKNVITGAAAAYLVFTAWTTVRPLPGNTRRMSGVLLLLPLLFAAGAFTQGFAALDRPGRQINGVPAGMHFFLASIFTLAALGDVRVMLTGSTKGTQRLARHLWRMCFALFIASGSFVAQLVRMPFMPASMRSLPVILFLSAGPLVVLLYWMWRVRLRHNLRGVLTAKELTPVSNLQ